MQGRLDRVVLAIDIAWDTVTAFRRILRMAAKANATVVALASVGLAWAVASILVSNWAAVAAALTVLVPPRERR